MKDFNKNLSSALFFLGVIYLASLVAYIVIFQDKLFIAIISVLGTLFVQRYLEASRNEREQQKFARLVITLVHWRNMTFSVLRTQIILPNNYSIEVKNGVIMKFLNQIKQEEVYKSMLKDISILSPNILKCFFNYDFTLKNLLDYLEDHNSNSAGISLGSSQFQENLVTQIIINRIDGELTIMLLEKLILKDQKEFETRKQFLVSEYWRIKNEITQGIELDNAIFGSLSRIEIVFEEIGISNELNICSIPNNQ